MANKIMMSMLRRRGPKNNKSKSRRRRTKKIRIRAPLPYLPETILEEIFHKLSLKDMVRSKLVCLTWNSILSSPKFMDEYYSNRGLGNNILILCNYDESYGNVVKVGSSLLSMQPSEDHKVWGITGRITFVGTYNGLVAIACGPKLILWNPLTAKHSSVCFKGNHCHRHFVHLQYYDLLLCGLCYDVNKDVYHVVAAWDISFQGPIDACLHSFEDGTERMVDLPTESGRLFHWDSENVTMKGSPLSRVGKVIRGLPHWVVENWKFFDRNIFYFDLEDDEFKYITPPPDGGYEKILLDLTTTGGEDQLGCVLQDSRGSCFEVWVMKEHGKPESWTNLYKIQYSKDFPSLGLTSQMNVFEYMPSGGVLFSLVLSTQFVDELDSKEAYYAYHTGKGELRKIELQDDDELKYVRLRTCHLKLTSPPKSTKDESRHT